MMAMRLEGGAGDACAAAALVAAAMNGLSLEDATATGAACALVAGGETLAEGSAAAAKYVAGAVASEFYPTGPKRAEVDAWVDAAAAGDAAALLAKAEAALAERTYLVGDCATLADASVAAALAGANMGAAPSAARWLNTVSPQLETARAGAAAAVDDKGWPAKRVRDTFVDFFAEKKGHTRWPSSPVVPLDDPTLLFTNAGMNQYKPIFLGKADPKTDLAKLTRATNTQKCIRAGGKHNDLDDVGKDTYHHTFFEMLGNWSFGDYFKREAITWAWELLTEVYKLDPERLYATYFGGDESQGLPPDDEAKAIWLEVLPAHRVMPFDCKDNFWEMGDVGPCGPCTEIHYDRIGGRQVPELVNMDDPDLIEIWNNVFIQFNREKDGELRPLPAKHVDTGMGFERITSILQDKPSNYDTDVFTPLFDAIQASTGARAYAGKLGDEDVGNVDMAYRVVADHIRTITFAIADGARPGSDGRNYVLRRVLRRAVRYGREVLNAKEGFFSKLVGTVVATMGDVFPEIVREQANIEEIIAEEEASFGRTLVKGCERFASVAKSVKAAGGELVSGEDAFLLWDTFGFPVDLTQLMAEEKGLNVDMDGFNATMEAAKERSRAARKAGAVELKMEAEATAALKDMGVLPTDDAHKYGATGKVGGVVKAVYTTKGFVKSTAEAEEGAPLGLVLDKTACYAEQGGQIFDTGAIKAPGGAEFTVVDVQVAAGFVLHIGSVKGAFAVGDAVEVEVDMERRALVTPNHTCTHSLNLALREVLGDHVQQKGSLVTAERLRFDFNHPKPVTPAELEKVEGIVRKAIADKLPVYAKETPLEDARAISGLRAVFGETYPDPVRVVSVGASVEELLAAPGDSKWTQLSIEFCGGTHLSNTSEAEAFALVQEEGTAKGIRRVLAVTRDAAKKAIATGEEFTKRVEAAKKLAPKEMDKESTAIQRELPEAVMPCAARAVVVAGVAELKKKLIAASKKAGGANKEKAIGEVRDAVAAAGGAPFVVVRSEIGLETAAFKEAVDAEGVKKGVAVMIVSSDAAKGRVLAYCGVPKDVEAKGLDALGWLKATCVPIGGKGGGGKNGVAQGQGGNIDGAAEAAAEATKYAQGKL